MDIPRPEQKQQRLKRRIVIAAAAALLLAAVTAGLGQLKPAAPGVPRASIWVDQVRRGEMLVEVTGPGTLIPRESRWITAQSDARVERILVRAGSRVEPDTVIVETSNPDLTQQTAAALYDLKVAQAALADARLRLRNEELDQRVAVAAARADYDSMRLQMEAEKPLADQGIVPALQYKRSTLLEGQLKVRMETVAERLEQFTLSMNARVEAQLAQVEQMRAIHQRRVEQVESLRVRAGFAGVLQDVLVQEGQRVALGANIARVAKPDSLDAQLQIPQSQAHLLQAGQRATVDTRNGTLQARVSRIDPAVQAGSVKVDLELVGPLPAGVRPDLAVDGTIQIEKLENVLFTGRPAFGQANASVRIFRLVDGGAHAEQVAVKFGRMSARAVEITQGLAAGDQVILSETSAWTDHQRIRLTD
jgi:HlyD family secretion protein